MNLTVNASATGVWSSRTGTVLELVRPGANAHHLIVRRPGERRTFGMPVAWVDEVKAEAKFKARGLRVTDSVLA